MGNRAVRLVKPQDREPDDGRNQDKRITEAYNSAIGALRHLEKLLIEERDRENRNRPYYDDDDDRD